MGLDWMQLGFGFVLGFVLGNDRLRKGLFELLRSAQKQVDTKKEVKK